MSEYFLLTSAQLPGKKLEFPLGKAEQKIHGIHLCQCRRVLPGGEPTSPSFKGFWVCKLVQVCKMIGGCNSLFLGFKLDFCFLDLELFFLYRSSKDSVSFLSISRLGTPQRSIGQCPRTVAVRLFDWSLWLLLWFHHPSQWPRLPLVVTCSHHRLALATLGSNHSRCIGFSVQPPKFPLWRLTYRKDQSQSPPRMWGVG